MEVTTSARTARQVFHPWYLNEADPLLSALSANGGPTATMRYSWEVRRGMPFLEFPHADPRRCTRPQGSQPEKSAPFEADFVVLASCGRYSADRRHRPSGPNFTFTAAASGTPPIADQWRQGSTHIPGALLPTFNISFDEFSKRADSATYSIFATIPVALRSADGLFGCDPVRSNPQPTDSVQPSPLVANTNFSVTLTVRTHLQWWHNDSRRSLGH